MNRHGAVSLAVLAIAAFAVSAPASRAGRPSKRHVSAGVPVILALTPDHAALTQVPGMDPQPTQSVIVVRGKGIRPGAQVIWGGTPLTATYVSPTELDVVVDWRLMAPVPHGSSRGPDTTSHVIVKVRNPGGKASRPATFTVVLTVLGG